MLVMKGKESELRTSLNREYKTAAALVYKKLSLQNEVKIQLESVLPQDKE